jgi:multiple sugar transport system permease protein
MATLVSPSTTILVEERYVPQIAWHERNLVRKFLYHGFVLAATLIMIYPLLWLFGSSFKAPDEIFTNISAVIPKQIYAQNYTNGWAGFGGITFTTFYRNSFFYAAVGTILNVSM